MWRYAQLHLARGDRMFFGIQDFDFAQT